ncbi:MAG: hypothetical protein ACTSR8_03080 [Promethearchaeota archaeon]
MTINREHDMIVPKMMKETINYTEYFDIETFFIPAELYISDQKIGW